MAYLNLVWLMKHFIKGKIFREPRAPIGIRTREHLRLTLDDTYASEKLISHLAIFSSDKKYYNIHTQRNVLIGSRENS